MLPRRQPSQTALGTLGAIKHAEIPARWHGQYDIEQPQLDWF